MKRVFCLLLTVCLVSVLFLSACGKKAEPTAPQKPADFTQATTTAPSVEPEKIEIPEKPEESANSLEIACTEGTDNCWVFDGNTLIFSGLEANTVCTVSGVFEGNILIDAGEDFKFELEMRGFSLWSPSDCPISVLSGDKVTLTAKKDTENYIYDTREAAEEEKHAAIYAVCDLNVGGKGKLTVISSANNGIHTKDDLEIKNLTLSVACEDNALKGNDSVTVVGGTLTLIARSGDGIKTSNTDVSSKGNQRGTVTLSGCAADIYAACDGIDAAYDVEIGEDTVLNIYTDQYSPYSEEVTAVDEDCYYICFSSKSYAYSIKYYNSDADFKWANASYKTSVSAGRGNYYYYSVPKETGFEKVQFFIYSSEQPQGQEEEYLACSDYLTWNTAYDTFLLVQNGSTLSYSWTNYTTSMQGMGGFPGGPGGMMDGNSDKGDHSTKGIKAGNEIMISGGTITVRSYDDALHANKDATFENGENPTGNVTVSGGTLTLQSNDDGIHADGMLTVSGGTIRITNSYEGLEGTTILISGGDISIVSKDDGINATASSGTGITFEGGTVNVYAGGDGLDANSRSAYQGILFAGGDVTVISTSGGNSSIDTEQGYTYTGGRVLAICPSGGMGSESTKCQNFASIATKTNLSLKNGQTLTSSVSGKAELSVNMPTTLSALVIYLGSANANFAVE